MMRGISKNNILKRAVAVILAGVISVSLKGGLSDNDRIVFESLTESDDYDVIINEDHLLSEAFADGKFDGDGSDYAIGGEGEYEDADKKLCINILEIVPDERMAMAGYTIAGCEPVDITILDALVNQKTGRDGQQWMYCPKLNGYGLTDLATNKSNPAAMYYVSDTMNGYYEYVGSEKGVYALITKPKGSSVSGNYVKNVEMQSKFSDSKESVITGYNYVWVEDDSLTDFVNESFDHKTEVSKVGNESKLGDRIYVYDHQKHRYLNNDLFLCTMSSFCSGLNNTYGIYTGGSVNAPSTNNVSTSSNYSKVKSWRESNSFKVITREPGQVTLGDVDNADLIIVACDTADGSYTAAFNIASYIKSDNSSRKALSSSNDISADVLKRIYKHIVVDEDCAIAYSHGTASGSWQFNTNVGRLACMLFFVNNLYADEQLSSGESKIGTGRDFFKNLLNDYGGDISNTEIDQINGTKTTDYLYIDGSGMLVVDGSSSSGWNIDGRVFKEDWMFNNDLRYHFVKDSYGNWRNGVYISGDYNGLGFYAQSTQGTGRYRNQLCYMEDHTLLAYVSGWAGDLAAINNATNHTPHYTEDGTTNKSYFLSMNIVNGDTMTKEAGTDDINDFNRNKTLYINKYEINEMPESFTLPLQIKIVTSHPIKSVKVTKAKRSGVPLQDINTYSVSPGVLDGGGMLGSLELKDETKYTDGKAPYISEKDYYKYTLSGEIELEKKWFKTGSNNTIMIEATNGVGKSAKDIITIVTRDFFALN